MRREENLFPLKMLVISLGFLLVGGMVVLAGAAYQKISEKQRLASGEGCDGSVNFADAGEVIGVYPGDANVRILVRESESRAVLVTVDACTGTPRGKLVIEGKSGS